MKKFSHILACTDFSEPGNKALSAAFGLAAGVDANVVLFHVLDTPPKPNPMYAHYYPTSELQPEHLEQAKAKAIEALKALVSDEARSVVKNIEYVVVEGDDVEEILREAKERKVDAIVVGTSGHGSLVTMILGSVVDRIVRMAPCPVLIDR